jgi:hypothetical protein
MTTKADRESKDRNARYQREFRRRHKDSGEKTRLDLIVPTPTWEQLHRLARYKSYTVIDLIAELAAKAESRTLDRMSLETQKIYLDGNGIYKTRTASGRVRPISGPGMARKMTESRRKRREE